MRPLYFRRLFELLPSDVFPVRMDRGRKHRMTVSPDLENDKRMIIGQPGIVHDGRELELHSLFCIVAMHQPVRTLRAGTSEYRECGEHSRSHYASFRPVQIEIDQAAALVAEQDPDVKVAAVQEALDVFGCDGVELLLTRRLLLHCL